MTPVHVATPVIEAASTALARGTPSPTDPVNLGMLAASLLAIVVTVTIAIWQHRDLRRYRQADQAIGAQHEAHERSRQDRRDRRESWEPVFREIQELLIKLEDVESEAREVGPLDRDSIDRRELRRIQRRLENVSGRCPCTLHDPLQAVASAVTGFQSIVFLPDAVVTSEYAQALDRALPGAPVPEIKASTLGGKGIEQYKMAVALHKAIGNAWDAVHTERGGES
jgi:hypothetical protein